jgi:hypothetical protein
MVIADTAGDPLPSQAKEPIARATELATKRSFYTEEARTVATELGIDFGALGCDLEQFRMGWRRAQPWPSDPETDASGNDPIVTGKIARAHLTEFPDYYPRLAALEREVEEHLRSPG